jgi:hypothetical protein
MPRTNLKMHVKREQAGHANRGQFLLFGERGGGMWLEDADRPNKHFGGSNSDVTRTVPGTGVGSRRT